VVEHFKLTAADPDKLRILFDACKTADLVKRLDDAAGRDPLTVKGSMGQQVINPVIAQCQASRMQPAQLLTRLNLSGATDSDSLEDLDAHSGAVRAWANNQAPGLAAD
jgi:hypothetical protein